MHVRTAWYPKFPLDGISAYSCTKLQLDMFTIVVFSEFVQCLAGVPGSINP